MLLSSLSILSVLATCAIAGFPPSPEGTTIKQVDGKPGVSISWKETTICETTAKGYAGYVNLPISELADIESADPYNVSMFFWYFEARHNPQSAPTTIYLAGGPGESSMVGATQSGGPCTILPDANTTADNPWAWNRDQNMLYVDQPVGSGFSYDTLIKSTQDLLYLNDDPTFTGITPLEAWDEVPAENATFLYGTFPSQTPDKTANNSVIAARTLWHFSQVWFSDFPAYTTTDKSISIWGNSYGGYWVPASAEFFVRQNEKINAGDIDGKILDVASIGWTNGCLDQLYHSEFAPDMAYNNTYDLQVIPEEVYLEAKNNFTKPGGCRDLIQQCRALGSQNDPDNLSLDPSTNDLCVSATLYCATYVIGAYDYLSNRSDFDMAHLKPEPFAPSYYTAFFNHAWVQSHLGVPVNFTQDSQLISNNFLYSTGDPFRFAGKASMDFLLAKGVRIAMVYGDRDYRCPWLGAEQLSLAVGGEGFRNAGYEFIQTGDCAPGGVVRQSGNLSFTRVFQSGHDPAAYKPHIAFEIFNRAVANRDIASGRITVGEEYTTEGPLSSFHIREVLPEAPAVNCNLYNVGASCTTEQYEALVDGTAVIEDWTVVWPVGGSPGVIQY